MSTEFSLQRFPPAAVVQQLIEQHARVSGDIVPIDGHTWAIHGLIAVDGDVIMAEFDDLDYMLATIIWHEMAHLSGADEHGARKAEQELWTRYVRDGVCDQMTALRYLRALAARPDDTVMAGMR